ncbi:MAG: hypothetical protein AB7Q23_09565 [Hyphomonadaceae bacterium]
MLKDRLHASAVFSGIAIAAVAGFELVITGSLDAITPNFGEARESASHARSAAITPWAADAYTAAPTSLPQLPPDIVSAPDSSEGGLAGEVDAPPAPEPSGVDLRAQIDALYEQGAAYAGDLAIEAAGPDTPF